MPRKKVSITNLFKSLDMFGSSVTFNIDGQETVKSYIGSFLSFVLISVTIMYAFTRYQVMINFDDTNYSETLNL